MLCYIEYASLPLSCGLQYSVITFAWVNSHIIMNLAICRCFILPAVSSFHALLSFGSPADYRTLEIGISVDVPQAVEVYVPGAPLGLICQTPVLGLHTAKSIFLSPS